MKFRLLIIIAFLIATNNALAAGLVGAKLIDIGNNQFNAILSSSDIDLDTSFITWQKGDAVLSSASGLKSLTLPVSTGLVDIFIEKNDGQQISLQIDTTPTKSADIIWEASSQIPPFYKGKRLPTGGASVKLWVPADKNNEPLIYDWLIGGRKSYDSGVGKNILTLPFFGGTPVSVKISDTSGKVVFSGPSIDIPGVNPRVILYQQAEGGQFKAIPTGGIIETTSNTATIKAVPLFFNRQISQLEPRWYINDKNIVPDKSKFLFNLTSKEQQKASVSAIITGPVETGSGASQKIFIDFRKNSSLF